MMKYIKEITSSLVDTHDGLENKIRNMIQLVALVSASGITALGISFRYTTPLISLSSPIIWYTILIVGILSFAAIIVLLVQMINILKDELLTPSEIEISDIENYVTLTRSDKVNDIDDYLDLYSLSLIKFEQSIISENERLKNKTRELVEFWGYYTLSWIIFLLVTVLI